MPAVVLAPIHSRNIKCWTTIAHSAVAGSALTGIAAETTLAIISLAGGSVGPNGQIKVTAMWSMTGSGTKTLRVRIAGAAFLAVNQTVNLSIRGQCIIENRNAQNSQITANVGSQNPFTGTTGTVQLNAVDLSVDQTMIISGQVASGGETMILESYTVETLYGA